MEIAEKLKFTRDLITAHIINSYTPEELIAMELFRKGITEAEYFNMRHGLNVDEPTVIKIANYLRDNWRTRNET